MSGYKEDSSDVPLLAAYPLFQRLIIGSFRKKQYMHTKSQLVIMITLNSRDTLTMTQIAQFISASNEQATRAVAPLAEEGLIERCTDSQNRTHVLIRLTEKGRDYISLHLKDLCDELRRRLVNSLTAEEQAELNEAVRTCIRLLEKVK